MTDFIDAGWYPAAGGTFTVVSGGQTGVDRAALDAAMAAGLHVAGWCPRGRRAEDGPIPLHYPLRETKTAEYAERTTLNVRDSDATLILNVTVGAWTSAQRQPDAGGRAGSSDRQVRSGGTDLTAEEARRRRKPLLQIQINDLRVAERVATWLDGVHPSVLNIAGPRESEAPGIYDAARTLLEETFQLSERPPGR